ALADVEGRDETAVTVEGVAADRTAARWFDRGVPQAREYDVPSVEALAPFPDPPDSWSACPAALLDALARRRGADLETLLLAEFGVAGPQAFSLREASGVIDRLKAGAVG